MRMDYAATWRQRPPTTYSVVCMYSSCHGGGTSLFPISQEVTPNHTIKAPRVPHAGRRTQWIVVTWWVWAGYYGIQAHCQRRRQGQYSQSYIHPLFRSCSCCHRLELFSVTGFIAISNKRLNSTWNVAFVHRFSCCGWRKRKQCQA